MCSPLVGAGGPGKRAHTDTWHNTFTAITPPPIRTNAHTVCPKGAHITKTHKTHCMKNDTHIMYPRTTALPIQGTPGGRTWDRMRDCAQQVMEQKVVCLQTCQGVRRHKAVNTNGLKQSSGLWGTSAWAQKDFAWTIPTLSGCHEPSCFCLNASQVAIKWSGLWQKKHKCSHFRPENTMSVRGQESDTFWGELGLLGTGELDTKLFLLIKVNSSVTTAACCKVDTFFCSFR